LPEIKIGSLSFTYENRSTPALKDVNLSVEKGELILLAGQSGSGKSTLIKCLNGLIPHRYVGAYSGEVWVSGKRVSGSNLLELGLTVGTVLQEVEKQIVAPVVEDEIAFGPANMALSRETIEERVQESVTSLGLKGLRKRFTFALSGGQKQKLAIADIVSMEPSIILFDEPLANLDSEGVALMQQSFSRMSKEGKTVIVAEHRTEEVLKAGPNRVVVMDQGQIVADSKSPDVLAEYVDVLKVPAEYVIKGRMTTMAPRVERVTEGEELVECKDLVVEYPGGVRALDGVSLRIRRGERVALLGNNGAGKSTLALALTGIVRPSVGSVIVKGRNSKELGVADIARTIAVVFQSPFLMLFSKTVRDELSFGPKNIGMGADEMREVVLRASKECGIEQLIEGSPFATSFGEKKRVCVVAVLTMNPECIVLDEPTAGQDYANCTRFMNFIDSIQSAKSFVVITHDPDLAIDHTDRAVVMHGGKVIADGPTKKVLAQDWVLKEAAIRETSLIRLSKRYTGGDSVLSREELVEVASGRLMDRDFANKD
jgi:energy-coupling factor transport system ATP-binding protein